MAENRTIVTRRSLLQISWQTAALAGVANACQYLPGWKRPKQTLQNLTAESFRSLEGSDVVFSSPVAAGRIFSRTVAMKLDKVTTHEHITRVEAQNPPIYGRRSREPFSLLFSLKGTEPLGDGLHRLIHEDFDGCQVFLSQVSLPRPDGTLLYEAVFG